MDALGKGPSSIDGKTPYELFTGKISHLNRLHVFGTDCYIHVPKQNRQKWDAKGKRGVFVGYSEDVDGYRLWIKPGIQIIRSRDVVLEQENIGKTLAMIPVDKSGRNQDENDNGRVLDSSMKNEVMLAEVDEPRCFAEAVKCEDWKSAMEDEMKPLEENSTWCLMELPVGCKSISNRREYRNKRKSTGEIDRYKARLVVRGFSLVR